jgi:hypothetical protein
MRNSILKFSAVGIFAAFLGACAPTVKFPVASYVSSGVYVGGVDGDSATRGGIVLALSGSGRFVMTVSRGGCVVAEDRGEWRSSQESLDLRVMTVNRREGCAFAWRSNYTDTTFSSPIRAVHTRAFDLLHDGVYQGSRWVSLVKPELRPAGERISLANLALNGRPE